MPRCGYSVVVSSFPVVEDEVMRGACTSRATDFARSSHVRTGVMARSSPSVEDEMARAACHSSGFDSMRLTEKGFGCTRKCCGSSETGHSYHPLNWIP